MKLLTQLEDFSYQGHSCLPRGSWWRRIDSSIDLVYQVKDTSSLVCQLAEQHHSYPKRVFALALFCRTWVGLMPARYFLLHFVFKLWACWNVYLSFRACIQFSLPKWCIESNVTLCHYIKNLTWFHINKLVLRFYEMKLK